MWMVWATMVEATLSPKAHMASVGGPGKQRKKAQLTFGKNIFGKGLPELGWNAGGPDKSGEAQLYIGRIRKRDRELTHTCFVSQAFNLDCSRRFLGSSRKASLGWPFIDL